MIDDDQTIVCVLADPVDPAQAASNQTRPIGRVRSILHWVGYAELAHSWCFFLQVTVPADTSISWTHACDSVKPRLAESIYVSSKCRQRTFAKGTVLNSWQSSVICVASHIALSRDLVEMIVSVLEAGFLWRVRETE